LTRQKLIDAIQNLYTSKNENKHNILNDIYIFHKYPEIQQLFSNHRNPNEKWPQLVREIIIADSAHTNYMFNRTIQLINRIGKNPNNYFKIKTETGTYTLPDRLSNFNKLMQLFEKFFCEILPGLTKRLSIDAFAEEQKNPYIKGKIQWNKTISDQANCGCAVSPLLFSTANPIISFNTPENILLVLSILRMKNDATYLLMSKFPDPLTTSERNSLERIIEGCNRCLILPAFKELINEAIQYCFVELDNPKIISLETRVLNRTQDVSPQNTQIREHLEWRAKYRELYVRIASNLSTRFPLDHIENIDKIYEIWVLLEILDFLNQRGFEITIVRFPDEFAVSRGSVNFRVHYEKTYHGWGHIGAKPDFTIEKEEKLVAVLDAKNWLLDNRKDAMYKMMGYLNNLDACIGILFFPTNAQLGDTQPHYGNPGLKYHKNQCLYNCVLSPSPSITDNHNLTNNSNLEILLGIILKAIN
jgi:hypothetical protein